MRDRCEAIYCVKVEAEKLTTTLTVTNTGGETIEGQQALFHTYYVIEDKKVLDKYVCNVKGLKWFSVVDKSPGEGEPAEFTQEDELVFVYKEIDRICSNPLKPDLVIRKRKKTKAPSSAIKKRTNKERSALKSPVIKKRKKTQGEDSK